MTGVFLPRLVPVGIAFFRYLMVCHPIFSFNLGDKKLWRTIQNLVFLITFAMGVTSYFYRDVSKDYLTCMGKEEIFW